MTDTEEKILTFHVIAQKLDDIQRDIAYVFNSQDHVDNSRSYWKQPHIWVLSKLETRIQDAKRITLNFLQKIKKGEFQYD